MGDERSSKLGDGVSITDPPFIPAKSCHANIVSPNMADNRIAIKQDVDKSGS